MNNRLARQIWDSDVYNRILTYNLRTSIILFIRSERPLKQLTHGF